MTDHYDNNDENTDNAYDNHDYGDGIDDNSDSQDMTRKDNLKNELSRENLRLHVKQKWSDSAMIMTMAELNSSADDGNENFNVLETMTGPCDHCRYEGHGHLPTDLDPLQLPI